MPDLTTIRHIDWLSTTEPVELRFNLDEDSSQQTFDVRDTPQIRVALRRYRNSSTSPRGLDFLDDTTLALPGLFLIPRHLEQTREALENWRPASVLTPQIQGINGPPLLQGLWRQGLGLDDARAALERIACIDALHLDARGWATRLGPGPALDPCYAHLLPRMLLRSVPYDPSLFQESNCSDNTDAILSMTHLLDMLVQRFDAAGRGDFGHLWITSGYLYERGFVRLIELLEAHPETTIRFLFSGRGDASSRRALTALFNEQVAGAITALTPEQWGVCQEAIAQGRLDVRVYTRAFLHAKMFLLHDGQGADARGKLRYAEAMVGSSNLTGPGLNYQGNLELNVIVEDGQTRAELHRWFEGRWAEGKAPEPALLATFGRARTRRRSTTTEPPEPPEFATRHMLEVWRQGLDGDLVSPAAHHALLWRLYAHQLDGLEGLDGDPFPGAEAARRITPTPEQRDGARQLASRLLGARVAFLADSVGLGKTVTALGAVWYLHGLGCLDRAGVIAPRKLHDQWAADRDAIGMPGELITLLNRHRLQLTPQGDDVELLDQLHEAIEGLDLLIIEEAHEVLRNHRNNLWGALRGCLERRPELMVLMVSATPWNNSRADIFNYLRAVWGPELSLDPTRYPALRQHPLSRYMYLFERLTRAEGEREFVDLEPARYQAIFKETFVQRTRHGLGKRAGALEDFPERRVWADQVPPSPTHDALYDELAQAIDELTLPHYQIVDALTRATRRIDGDEEPRESNLMGSFRTQLYKRAESSLFALRVSLGTLRRRLETLDATLRRIEEADDPVEALDAWLREVYVRLEDESLLGDELDGFTLDVTEQMGTFERRRYDTYIAFMSGLDAPRVKRILEEVRAHDIEGDLEHVTHLEAALSCDVEASDPKLLALLDLVERPLVRCEKVVLIGGYADTAARFFVELVARYPNLDIGLALGGGRGWVHRSGEHTSEAMTPEQWLACVQADSSSTRLRRMLEDSGRAAAHDRADVLAAFAPMAKRATEAQREALPDLDVLVGSEAIAVGHNLQDATTMIHLDMPWNPMVIEQRIGRIDRRGGGRPDPDDPGGRRVIDVHYVWSVAAIDRQIQLRNLLEKKASGAIDDTNFDELLLEELERKLNEARERRRQLDSATVGRVLGEGQRAAVEARTRVPETSDLVGARVDGLLALGRTTPPEISPPDRVWFGCAGVSEAPRVAVTLTVCPQGIDGAQLGRPSLVHLMIEPDEELPARQDLGLVVNVLDDVRRDAPADPRGHGPWTRTLRAVDDAIARWRKDTLTQHNEMVRARTERDTRRPKQATLSSETDLARSKAYDRLLEQAKTLARSGSAHKRGVLTANKDRLEFLLVEVLKPANGLERVIQDFASRRELIATLDWGAHQAANILGDPDQFDAFFTELCGPAWARHRGQAGAPQRAQTTQGELGLDASRQHWGDLDVEVTALTLTAPPSHDHTP